MRFSPRSATVVSMPDPIDPRGERAHRTARAVILVAFACLLVAVLGMLALGLALVRS